MQTEKQLQKYMHDYKLVASALHLLNMAQSAINLGYMVTASDYVNQACFYLDDYMSRDNTIPDDDIYPGWYKAYEVDELLTTLTKTE